MTGTCIMASLSLIADFAQSLSISEAALRLVVTLLLNYPIALYHRSFLHNKGDDVKHVFFIGSGLTMAYFNFGTKVVHSMLTVLSNYVLLELMHGSYASVLISFVFNMGYLILAYWEVYGEVHDVTWATAQCVLTLKMIGLAFNLFDGCKSSKDSLSSDQELLKLETSPSLLQMAGFTYFSGGFLVGPQFSMRRYLDFTEGKLSFGNPTQTTAPALKCLLLGITYCVLMVVVSPVYPSSFLLSEAFQESMFIYKLFVLCVWGEFMRWKFVAVWLLAEGSCVLSGLTYNGRDHKGAPLWNACSNIKLYQLETAVTLKEVVNSFNCNTNIWVSRYIYKRLKFLGSRMLSQAISLLFISVWHGLYFGYYMAFLLEFFLQMAEIQMQDIVKKTCLPGLTGHPMTQIPLLIIRKITVLLILGYALVAFVFLHRESINKVHSSVFYLGHLSFLWPVLYYGILKPKYLAKPAASTGDNSKAY